MSKLIIIYMIAIGFWFGTSAATKSGRAIASSMATLAIL